MYRRRRPPAGFSLIEVLLVISLMAILAGLVLPNSSPSIHDQLQATAQIVSGDLAYGRSLAVTHNSRYRIDFDVSENRYVLSHSGSDASLDALPDSPWRNPDDPADKHVVDLDELPHLGVGVKIAAVEEAGSVSRTVGSMEFGPFGETTSSGSTVIWLAAGEGSARRYVSISVNPVTGLASIGAYTAKAPFNAS
jgi:prepilin-type N-terminal cleavage/methylation domain-containing protein